ncbi:MAG TPA: threonine synthase [Verrucomicrobiae bacterium]|nr:threonine synthase [Verrucomicrobiae bacterium]
MIDFVYQCSNCGKQYQRDEVRYLCPSCAKRYRPGIPLVGVLTVEFDYDAIRKRFDKQKPDWNLFSAVEEEYFPALPVGNTPFFKSVALGNELGFEDVWIKNDGLNPSGSLKDRASFLMVAEANRLGENTVVTASTGNAASALSAVCAAAGKRAVIFAPAKAPKAKLVQMLLHGASLVPVRGTYDDAFRLSLEYTASKGGLNRNTAYHPLTIEGKKTVGLEIFRQNDWKAPEVIFVPVGDGVILGGVYKAFYDLKAAGLIDRMPRLVCVQAETSAAIHHYIQTGKYKNADRPVTIADSISVSIPSNAHMARNAVLATEGFSVTVSDQEILKAQQILARKTGVFAEPAAAASVAGLKKSREEGLLDPKGQIVALVTGHGLKDIDAALKNVQMPAAVEPTLQGVVSALETTARIKKD